MWVWGPVRSCVWVHICIYALVPLCPKGPRTRTAPDVTVAAVHLIMAERTVVCESIAFSNDETNPVLAKRIREDCVLYVDDGRMHWDDTEASKQRAAPRRAHVGRNSRLMDARLDHGSGGAVRHR